MAASFAISSKQAVLLNKTGQFALKASKIGKPKPSYKDGYIKSKAFLYK